MRRKSVLHRVEVDIIHVRGEVVLIADRMLPVPTLPDAGLALAKQGRAPVRRPRDCAREGRLDRLPSNREVHVARRQGPQAMHMIRQHDPRVYVERVTRPRGSNGTAKGVDLGDKQIGMTIEEIDREEVRSTRYPVATIIWHSSTELAFLLSGVGLARRKYRFICRHAGWRGWPAVVG
jgi:hypothetical protein